MVHDYCGLEKSESTWMALCMYSLVIMEARVPDTQLTRFHFTSLQVVTYSRGLRQDYVRAKTKRNNDSLDSSHSTYLIHANFCSKWD